MNTCYLGVDTPTTQFHAWWQAMRQDSGSQRLRELLGEFAHTLRCKITGQLSHFHAARKYLLAIGPPYYHLRHLSDLSFRHQASSNYPLSNRSGFDCRRRHTLTALDIRNCHSATAAPAAWAACCPSASPRFADSAYFHPNPRRWTPLNRCCSNRLRLDTPSGTRRPCRRCSSRSPDHRSQGHRSVGYSPTDTPSGLFPRAGCCRYSCTDSALGWIAGSG